MTRLLYDETIHLAQFLPVIEDRFQELRRETQMVDSIILTGWPDISAHVPTSLEPNFKIRDELTVRNDILFKGESILIPETTKLDMLQGIHSSHIEVEGSLRRARENLFWLGMTKDVKNFVTKCYTCRSLDDKQRKETPK